MLEARNAVSGATGRNGGHLVSDSLALFSELVSRFGTERATEVVLFSTANIAKLKELTAQLDESDRTSVELRNVASVAGLGDANVFESAAEAIGAINQILNEQTLKHRTVSREEAAKEYKLRNIEGALVQEGAAALWPYRLVTALLARLVEDHPGRFSLENHTPVCTINHDPQCLEVDGRPYTLTTPRGTIRAKKVIHCTNGYSAHLIPNLVGKLYPLRGTMSVQKLGPGFPSLGGSVSWSHISRGHYDADSQLWSTGLYYAQQNEKTGHMWIGGEVQKLEEMLTSDDSVVGTSARENLCSVVPTLLEGTGSIESLNIWSGIMGFTADGLPLVGNMTESLTGRSGSGEWIAAGFNGHGMDKCWLSGEALARLALGEEVPEWFPRVFLLGEKRCKELTTEAAVERFTKQFI
ncbi:FAD dependent oxidoreductase superfamily protein [Pleurostoma richardsiae]|uniref:FAD dependent oxidoreductase superfamily protein n=1 Tax=Pleurostoma richardsiae TaxID=41990 RepID=A0AA38RGI3_9PEZI|nr:FAD dependent oxidoreductase superfamily protein [Pleurostoma richardsiae]